MYQDVGMFIYFFEKYAQILIYLFETEGVDNKLK